MWKIFNRLFGWHYVAILDVWGVHICRITVDRYGTLYGYTGNMMFFIDNNGKIVSECGVRISLWSPLTFTRDNMPVPT